MYRVVFTNKSQKELARLDKAEEALFLPTLKKLTYPFSKELHIKKLRGSKSSYRIRINKSRAVLELDKKNRIIWVTKVARRGRMYRLFLI